MSGATIAAINLIDTLAEYEVEPIIAIPKDEWNTDNKQLLDEIISRGWVYEKVHINALTEKFNERIFIKKVCKRIRRYIYHRVSIKELSKIIIKYNPIIIHTNTGVVQEGYQLSKKYNIPHVWHIREYQDRDFKYTFFPSKETVMKYYHDSYTVCITNEIQEYFGLIEGDTSKVIYDPLFTIKDIQNTVLEKENYFLVANRLSPEKGVEDLIIGFAKFYNDYCKNSNIYYKLVIAGEGSMRYVEELKILCKTCKVSNFVNFIGFQKDVKVLMSKARALLVGSYNEGFGMMTAEANMLGCPVIGRDSAGTKEIIVTTEGGILFNTCEELECAMIKVASLSQIELYDMMQFPIKKAIQSYNREKSAERVFLFYKDILAESSNQDRNFDSPKMLV